MVVPPAGRARAEARDHPRPADHDAAGAGAHLHARQDHVGRRRVRDRRSVRVARRRREGAGAGAEAVARRQGSPRDRHALHADGPRQPEPERDAHRRLGAQPDARRQRHRDGALGSRGQDSRACPTTTLLGGRFRDTVRVYDHAAPRNMLDKASVPEWAAQAKSHPSGFTCHKFGFRRSDPADRQGARPRQSHADDEGTDRDPSGLRELPRGDRLGPRHHGPLPLGIRPAHRDPDRRGGRTNAAAVARGSAAGRLLRIVEAAVRGGEGADLHGREPRAARGLQGLHPQPGLRHPAPRPAQLRRLPRDEAHRRPGGRLRPADGHPQHRQPGLHLRHRAMGRVDQGLHGARDGHRPGRLDGPGPGARPAVHPGRVHPSERQTRARASS